MELNKLQNIVTETVKSSNERVVNEIVDYFVSKEVKKRVEAGTSAMQEVEKLQKELLKFKPDQVSYDVDGKPVSETFSKTKIDERKKLADKIEKLRKALEKALDGDYGDLLSASAQKEPAAKE